ncbi:MAG: hypothetical protein IKJ14_02945 [Clostridia bacterium]|nr:hypothetical protein [Clostridia bacterium]
MAKLRDRLWLWGHPEGRYNNEFGNHSASRMTPMECCAYLGFDRTFMVPVGVKVDRRQYNKSFKPLKEVGWECYDAGNDPSVVDPLIKEAGDFKNITRVVFDDFHRYGSFMKMPVENLWKVHEKLHNNDVRPLDMWMVLYTHEFGDKLNKYPETNEQFKKYIEPFDGVIMWTWWEDTGVEVIPEKWEEFKAITPKQKRMFGCYLWNFGDEKPATGSKVEWQLNFYREQILKGEAEGIVLHTNTMADLDLESYDVAMKWIEEHADDEVPEI